MAALPLSHRSIVDSPDNYGMGKPEIAHDHASSGVGATFSDLFIAGETSQPETFMQFVAVN